MSGGGGSSAGSDRDCTGYDECGPCGRGGRAYRAHGACVDERTLLHQERVAFPSMVLRPWRMESNLEAGGGGRGAGGGGGERPLLAMMGAMGDWRRLSGRRELPGVINVQSNNTRRLHIRGRGAGVK
jgi:hypothetical protein